MTKDQKMILFALLDRFTTPKDCMDTFDLSGTQHWSDDDFVLGLEEQIINYSQTQHLETEENREFEKVIDDWVDEALENRDIFGMVEALSIRVIGQKLPNSLANFARSLAAGDSMRPKRKGKKNSTSLRDITICIAVYGIQHGLGISPTANETSIDNGAVTGCGLVSEWLIERNRGQAKGKSYKTVKDSWLQNHREVLKVDHRENAYLQSAIDIANHLQRQ
jgi:hypothetical protein